MSSTRTPKPRRPHADPERRIEHWFASRTWTPFAFQREVWDAYEAWEAGRTHATVPRPARSGLPSWRTPVGWIAGHPEGRSVAEGEATRALRGAQWAGGRVDGLPLSDMRVAD